VTRSLPEMPLCCSAVHAISYLNGISIPIFPNGTSLISMSYGVYCTAGCLPLILSRVLFRYLLSPSLPVHNPLSVMVHVTGIDALVFLKSNTRLILSRFRLFFAVF